MAVEASAIADACGDAPLLEACTRIVHAGGGDVQKESQCHDI
jgi:hypothetical protein